MFKNTFRAVVLAYNVPGIPDLILSREHIVGIYNGSIQWWNDSRIVGNNRKFTFPNKRIWVVARADDSGTTEVFTSALSSFDSRWNASYGTFRYLFIVTIVRFLPHFHAQYLKNSNIPPSFF